MLGVTSAAIARRTAQRFTSRIPFVTASHFHVTAKKQDDDSKQQPLATSTAPAKKSLWDPIYSIPLGIAFAVPAISYEWYIINEETQLAACFMAFVMIIYKNFGGSIHEFLEADGKKLLEMHTQKEGEVIDILKSELQDMKQQTTIVEDAAAIQALKEEAYAKLNAAGQIKPQHEFKAQVEKILTMIANEEATMVDRAKHALMSEATTSVRSRFSSSKDLQKSSLDVAIAQLQGKKSDAATKDPVQQAFVEFFQAKAKDAAKQDEAAEIATTRAAMVRKLNAMAMNENFYFQLDEKTGKPKMVV